MRRILLIGATGVFGQRLAQHLRRFSDLELILTSRNADKAARLADSLSGGAARVRGVRLDHRERLSTNVYDVAPWLVIDASGPFQGAGYDVPLAAIEAGAHVVDLADARDYLAGYAAALDGPARRKGLVALAGASSTPGLSTTAVDALTEGWRRVDSIEIAITPGGRGEVGRAVIAAILSYAGNPIPIWREGELQQIGGWCESGAIVMPGLGRRRVAPVETVDAELLGRRHDVRSRVAFSAGLESPLERAGLGLLARLRRAGLVSGLRPLAPVLQAARRVTRITASDRGGMHVEVTGIDRDGGLVRASWSLLAERGDGPRVPALPAAAAVRALTEGLLASGARLAGDALTLGRIEAEMAPYAISTTSETRRLDGSVFAAAIGAAAFARLPAPLQAFHGLAGEPVWRGRARIVGGTNVLARLLCRAFGLPASGSDVPLTVTVARGQDAGRAWEIWTRNFAGRRFTTRLFVQIDGSLCETVGPFSIVFAPSPTGDGLSLPIRAWRFLGLRLPPVLMPRSLTREHVDSDGRFRFDVALTLPFFGLLTHYTGWLTPQRN